MDENECRKKQLVCEFMNENVNQDVNETMCGCVNGNVNQDVNGTMCGCVNGNANQEDVSMCGWEWVQMNV